MEEQPKLRKVYNGWKWLTTHHKTLCIFKTCGYKLIVTWSLFPGKTIASYGNFKLSYRAGLRNLRNDHLDISRIFD